MKRDIFIYNGEPFEYGELILVNGKDVMYCRGGYKWECTGEEVMFAIFAPQYKLRHRYEPYNENTYATVVSCSSKKGDKIQHVYDPAPYNVNIQLEKKEPITNGYLVDGWIICIILMCVTLILKPVGAWSLSVLFIWLHLRNEEIKRIKNMRK